MTQAREELLPRSLQLVSMKISESEPQPIGRDKKNSEFLSSSALVDRNQEAKLGKTGCKLVIYPEEPSEILVRVANHSNRWIYLDIAAEGNFPTPWCRIGMEGHTLPPGGEMEAVLYLQIPPDFFENNQQPTDGRALELDYVGKAYVNYGPYNPETAEIPEELPCIATQPFQLYVRPRSLYLNFLPDVYREVDFVGRILKLFEESFEPAVNALEGLWAYLDPLTAPESLLPFLAYWVGWELTPHLSLQRQRYLIRQAMEVYRWRGTRRGLRLYLHLFTGLPLDEGLPETEKHISISEVFGQGFVTGGTHLGQDSIVGGGRPYHFLVRLKPMPEQEIDLKLVKQIIEQEKPVFSTYELSIEQ
ncbi:MAG: phage tail protein [Spirulinaceae cyanobacterium]